MGVWGIRNFESDHAYNWLNTFFEDPTREELESVFEYILEQEDFLDNVESHAALVAGELIAAKIGKISSDFPKDINHQEELLFEVDELLKLIAIRAICKILYFEEHSELRELWQETDDYEEWVQVVNDLLIRLGYRGFRTM